ncbi:MAG TPA: nucleoside triphosphate pyrophosphohydrolase [Symbiobacteriaceae bacterium]|jgi:tetrapyrrole methylase family protein/MazG family protein
MRITIVGLGPGSPGLLTVGALEALRSGRPVLLRTAIHPTVSALQAMGIAFASCDDLYERGESFEAVYAAVAERVLGYDDVVFAVPGHPLVGESAVKIIRERAPERVEIVAGPSFLDTLLVTLGLDPVDGLELLDALQLDRRMPSGDLPAVIMQVHSRSVASDTKLALMDKYPDDHAVVLVRAAGVPGEERRAAIPLYELDRQDWVDYLTTLYVPALVQSKVGDADPRRWAPARWPLDPLVEVMSRLREPQGCPWDREQTHQTLRQYLLEEAYEAVEAMDAGDMEHLCEELGDVLLQVAFHAQVARERGDFDMHDIVQGITAKLVRRHPHIFGDVSVATASDVVRNWEAIKRAEKGDQAAPKSLLDGVAMGQPALSRAAGVQKKAAKVGFDWDDLAGPAAKVREEVDEVLAAGPNEVEEEAGDLLFAAVNLARRAGVDPEVALTRATGKFARRFRHIERRAAEMNRELSAMTLAEMDSLWEEAKEAELD